MPAPFDETKNVVFRDFLTKSNATRAQDAALVVERNARSKPHSFRFFDLVLQKTRISAPVFDAKFLEATFAGLIADRAIERMVDEEEFHDTAAAFLDQRRTGADTHPFGDVLRTTNLGARHPIDHRLAICAQFELPVGAHAWKAHFDQTHPAIPR